MSRASEHGTDIKVADAMQMIAQGWRKTIEKSAEKLFDGSEDSVLKLTLLISDVAMIEKKVISEPNPGEALGSLKKTLNSQLIPLVWSTTSAERLTIDPGRGWLHLQPEGLVHLARR
jgi:squalene cyclase